MPENKDAQEFMAAHMAMGAAPDVMAFIADFLYSQGGDNAETLRRTFRAGYCYYFAHMLEAAFRRGRVCWAAPYGHFVWVDSLDGNPYDIEGLYSGEAEAFVPERFLGAALGDFLHVRGKEHGTSGEEIAAILGAYRSETEQRDRRPR